MLREVITEKYIRNMTIIKTVKHTDVISCFKPSMKHETFKQLMVRFNKGGFPGI